MINDKFNCQFGILHRNQHLGSIINNDPLNLRFNPMNQFDAFNLYRDPLKPFPGHSGPLGPLGKPTGRW